MIRLKPSILSSILRAVGMLAIATFLSADPGVSAGLSVDCMHHGDRGASESGEDHSSHGRVAHHGAPEPDGPSPCSCLGACQSSSEISVTIEGGATDPMCEEYAETPAPVRAIPGSTLVPYAFPYPNGPPNSD